MKIVQINATCGIGSTGKICVGISKLMTANGIENYILYSSRTNGYPLGVACSSDRYIRMQALKSRLLGNYGFNSKRATQKILYELDMINPDIVHLHNIHGHDCNLEMLFSYFKENKTKLIWTFHDCWAFTGYCPHFTMMKCDKWRTRCLKCVQSREYSLFFDKSNELFEKKKQLFEEIDLTIVTPSRWLADLVKQSFLKEHTVKVINNGIDLSIFKPSESNFRQKYGLENKKIVLGVSFGWNERKGGDVFVDLARRLSEDYQIVLVGTDDKVDKKLPSNIISIHRTQNQQELAGIYSAADVFVNPTREENYPTVNMEAIACGTPVVTFRTGGSPEMIDNVCGMITEPDNIDALINSIVASCDKGLFLTENCTLRAADFDENRRYQEYLNMYKEGYSE